MDQPKPMFTVYCLEEAIELRSGRDESTEGQIYCSSLLYESALKIAQILASQQRLPFRNYVPQALSTPVFPETPGQLHFSQTT
ncbi:hypothetical protein K9N68_38010 (plasmid) [Kovacikia minuta CCNUW1]|uniref:hypothetical protein n=1 Tax=Kovacikia minuta TaxID=2931930 RepID=UPI001CCE4933|nr:hypothetical protein [Kovacikia minuta]UBF29999.1 hypothetical protein K9N68_38010 [Kovacikia minuta CCNUW1]